MSVSVLFQTILSNARLDRSKLDEKGNKVVKSPTAIAGRDQLNLAKFGSIQFSSAQFCSTHQNSDKLSLAQFCSTKLLSSIQHNSAQFSSIQPNTAQLNSAQLSSTQLSSAQLNSAEPFLCNTAGSQLTTGRFVMFFKQSTNSYVNTYVQIGVWRKNFLQKKVL